MNLPAICIVTAAKRDHANLVWDAMGRGPETFYRALCAFDEDATPESPITHYLASATEATDADVIEWQCMTQGNLPALAPGKVWGEDGVISAADALEATDGSQLIIITIAGNADPHNFLIGYPDQNGVRHGGALRALNLMFLPDDI